MEENYQISEQTQKVINKLVFLDLGCSLAWAKPRFVLYVPSFAPPFTIGKSKGGKISVMSHMAFLITQNSNLGVYPIPGMYPPDIITTRMWDTGRVVETRRLEFNENDLSSNPQSDLIFDYDLNQVIVKYQVNREGRSFALSIDTWDQLGHFISPTKIVGLIDSLIYPPPEPW